MRSTAGKWLELGHFGDLVVNRRVDKFPLSERAKSRNSAVVTLVSLSKTKIRDGDYRIFVI